MATRRHFMKVSLGAAAAVSLSGMVRAAVPGQESVTEALQRQLLHAKGDERVTVLLKLARRYHRDGRYAAEASTLEEVLATDKLRGFKSLFARLNYGKALYQAGDFAGAALILETLADEPFRYRDEATLYAARASVAIHDWMRAEKLIERLKKSSCRDKAVLLHGDLEMKRGRTLHALKHYASLNSRASSQSEQVLFRLMEANLRLGKENVARHLFDAAVAPYSGGLKELELRRRASHLFLRFAYPDSAIAIASLVPALCAKLSAKDRQLAAKIAPKAMTTLGEAYRMLERDADARSAFRAGRNLAIPAIVVGSRAILGGNPEEEIVPPLTGAARSALQTKDEPYLQETVGDGATVCQATATVQQTFNSEMGHLLRRYRRSDLWRPLAESLVDGDYAKSSVSLQAGRMLASACRAEGCIEDAVVHLSRAIGQANFKSPDDEIDSRLLLVSDLTSINRISDRDAELAIVDAVVREQPIENRPWFAYRAARALLKVEDYGAADARFFSVTNDHVGTREARKSLFMRARIAQEQLAPETAIDFYLQAMECCPNDTQYSVQAAVLALQVAEENPGIMAPETASGLLDSLLADGANDWRVLLHSAHFLAQHGKRPKAKEITRQALALFDQQIVELGYEPFSESWIRKQSKLLNSLYNLLEHQEIVDRVQAAGEGGFNDAEMAQAATMPLFTIRVVYEYSLGAVGKRDMKKAVHAETEALFAHAPEKYRRTFAYQRIHSTWNGESFTAAIPLIEEYLSNYPTTPHAYLLRLKWAIAKTYDGDYQGALDLLEPGRWSPPDVRNQTYKMYRASVNYVRGECLSRLGDPAGDELKAANKPIPWVVTFIERFPRR
ncbi:hypothetical protein KQI84_19450 [bacterium]|nr:hypothetical protein [bacterium]